MAWENYNLSISLPCSTGVRPYRAVKMGASALAYPANGGAIDGIVLPPGTTGSTESPQTVSICGQAGAVVKMEALSSTLSIGDMVIATSVGLAGAVAAGKNGIGRIVDGSSGGTNRIVSVLLQPWGSSVAPS